MLRRLALLAPLLAVAAVALWYASTGSDLPPVSTAAPDHGAGTPGGRREPVGTAAGPAEEHGAPLAAPLAGLAGRVVDFSTGAPVAGATVAGPATHATTDVDGRFLLDARTDARAGPGLRIYAPGHCILAFDPDAVPAGGDDLLVRLPRSASVHGNVRDARGAPVAGATVTPSLWERRNLGLEAVGRDAATPLSELPAGHRVLVEEVGDGATTGALGEFRLDALPPWMTDVPLVVAVPAGALETFVVDAVGAPGSSTRFDIVLAGEAPLGAALVGDVLVNGERVEAEIAWTCGHRRGVARASPPNPYRIEGLHGTVTLAATPRGWEAVPDGLVPGRHAVVAVAGDPVQRHDLELEVELAPIEGRVVEASGRPAADVRVTATAHGAAVARTRTDPDGSFALEAPAAFGPCDLTASDGARTAAVPGVAPGSRAVELVLVDLGTLRFRALAADTGAPIRRVGLQWRRPGEPLQHEPAAPAGPDGWREASVAAGSLEVALFDGAREHRAVAADGVVVPAGGVAEVALELPRGLTVELRLAGDPPPDLAQRPLLVVEPELARHVEHVAGTFHLRPDAPVTFVERSREVRWALARASVSGLRPGPYRFLVGPGTRPPQPAEFELRADGQVVDVRWEGP